MQKANYEAYRDKARNSLAGDIGEENIMALLEATPEEREQEFERFWRQGGFNYQYPFSDALTSSEANEMAAEFVRRKIRETVKDPKVAEVLCPKNHPFGAKRLCVDTDYYATFNRDNVTLVDLQDTPVVEVTRSGLKTTREHYEFDDLVLATGFDAMTGALTRIDISGRGATLLADKWQQGAKTYLGFDGGRFPKHVHSDGPRQPIRTVQYGIAIEQHVDWIADCLTHLRARGASVIEATQSAEDDWVQHVNDAADQTLYPQANSWYVGANVPGKARVFMPYVGGFKPIEKSVIRPPKTIIAVSSLVAREQRTRRQLCDSPTLQKQLHEQPFRRGDWTGLLPDVVLTRSKQELSWGSSAQKRDSRSAIRNPSHQPSSSFQLAAAKHDQNQMLKCDVR